MFLVQKYTIFPKWKRIMKEKAVSHDGKPLLVIVLCCFLLQLRTCSNQSLTCFVAGVFAEVLDEASSQILSLLFPL